MKKDITALFCFVDDFCKVADQWISQSFLPITNKKPTRKPEISYSELLTIVLLYHQSPYKNFKYFYMSYLQLYKSETYVYISNKSLGIRFCKHFFLMGLSIVVFVL